MEFKEVFEPIINFIKGLQKKETEQSKQAAKERLKLVLMQDRASVSPDFFEMMKQEIIEVIKKYIEIDEEALEVQLTRGFEDGLEGPALYANIPIKNIKPVAKKVEEVKEEEEQQEIILEESEEAIQEKIEEVIEEMEIVLAENEETVLTEEVLLEEELQLEKVENEEIILTEQEEKEIISKGEANEEEKKKPVKRTTKPTTKKTTSTKSKPKKKSTETKVGG